MMMMMMMMMMINEVNTMTTKLFAYVVKKIIINIVFTKYFYVVHFIRYGGYLEYRVGISNELLLTVTMNTKILIL